MAGEEAETEVVIEGGVMGVKKASRFSPLVNFNFQNIWTENLIKIIDSLHMHNHKRESCHTTFNPALLKKELPNSNTMICEQTFRDGNL